MMAVASLMLRSLLLLAVSETAEEVAIEEGSKDIRFKTDFLFYKPTFLEGYRLLSGVFQTTTVTSTMECLFQCTNDASCIAINYREDLLQENITHNCDLIAEDELFDEFVKDVRYKFYFILHDNLETVDFCSSSPCPYSIGCDAQSESCLCTRGYTGQFCEQGPPSTCYDVRMYNWEAGSGIYWIKPHPDREPIQVYCDMETEGGMWTLVYHYTFTSYDNFNTLSNAVFPRPNWPATEADVQTSTDSPVFGLGAVDYSLWEHIGGNFLITSNINDWIYCNPESGSLVKPINGSIYCRNIKDVTSMCSAFAPDTILWLSCGPQLIHQQTVYLFDGSSTSCWPVHNPCEDSWMDNYEKDVENPDGFIFLRP